MAVLAPGLKSRLQGDPKAMIRVIVRLKDDPKTHAADLEARGWIVHRVFSLFPGIAIEGSASAALTLSSEDWVVSIEEDSEVHAL